MTNYRKEYFNDHCYFLIEGNGDDFVLSYSIYSTISESKKNNTKKRIKKENLKSVEKNIRTVVNSDKKITKKELDELVDEDGTFNSSRIPILNKWLTPKKITSVTALQARTTGDALLRGYRRFWSENEDEQGNVISEINFDDTFGYKETKDKDFKDTVKTFKKMGIDDPQERVQRAKQLGKLPRQKVKKTKSGKKVLKQRLVEKEKIDDIKKDKMIKMVEDILTKKGDDKDVITKDDSTEGVNKILVKNLENIKKIAKKEGININKLINILKKGE